MADKDPALEPKSRWLTKEVFGFGLTSFFSDLSHEVATTLLPLFLASLGAPAYALGVIEGVADGFANIGKLLGGWISDRSGKRKPLALTGYILTGLTQGFFAFVTAWPQALWARTLGWFGRGWRSPIRDALFHQAVPPAATGRAFGFERMLDTLGAVIAPLLVLLFLSRLGFRNLFLWTWVPGILSFLCFFLLVKERRIIQVKKLSLFGSIKDFPPVYKKFLLGVTLFGMGDFSHTLLIYWAGVLLKPVYGTMQAAHFAIALYAIHNIIYALASYPAGRMGDKVGKLPILCLGYGIAALMFLFLASGKGNLGFLAVIFILAGGYMAVQDTLERAIAGDLLAAEIKGTGYGVLAFLNGIGDVCSSLIVGWLLTIGSPQWAFGYCFIISLCGILVISRLRLNPVGDTR